MDLEKVPAVVIGAGVVGCAIAQRLATSGLSPLVLESGPRIAEGVTSRNSGVIHAGLYYPPNSLKATSCIRGKELLVNWCKKNNVPWQNTGKWIVAQAGQEEALEDLFRNAQNSKASGLTRKSKQQLAEALPMVRGTEALFSSETGIVDAYAFSRSLLFSAEENGAMTILSAKVLGIEVLASFDFLLETTKGKIRTERVYNAAGLACDEVAKLAGVDKYKIYPWRGDYFRIKRDLGIRTLVYPARKKNAPGLGVHLTIELDGHSKLGPDVEFGLDKENFRPREEKRDRFWEAAQAFLPDLKKEDLQYDTCGLRPKLRSETDKAEHDFIVSEDLPGFTNFIGIESPGLTSAMALAERLTLTAR